MKTLKKTFQFLYLFIVILFVLDLFPFFDIKNQILKSICYFGILIGALIILINSILTFQKNWMKISGILLPLLFLVMILSAGVLNFTNSTSSWKTQTIEYEHAHSNSLKIEFQMQNVGAFGYNKRTVKVFYLSDLFMIISEIPKNIETKIEWKKVNKSVNEHELKPLDL